MRLFALLFALYLACLSCLPCADEVQVCIEQAQTSISATSHSDYGNVLGDWCSPLCQCHCCAGAVLASAEVVVTFAKPIQWVRDVRHASLRVAAATQATGTVWQPPRA